jgi:hypothetical protein
MTQEQNIECTEKTETDYMTGALVLLIVSGGTALGILIISSGLLILLCQILAALMLIAGCVYAGSRLFLSSFREWIRCQQELAEAGVVRIDGDCRAVRDMRHDRYYLITQERGVRDLPPMTGYDRAADIPEPDEIMPAVLPVIDNALVCCLYGPQGTGKTSLLCHALESRRGEQVYVIDPHGYEGKYPHGQMLGAGRDYKEIDSALTMLVRELDRRYSEYAGQDFERLSVFIDELTLLNKHCHNFKDFMPVMLTESRKVGIRIVFCVHSDRAEILGLKGSYDLADGMTKIALHNDNGNRFAEIAGQTYALPGAYPQQTGMITRNDTGKPSAMTQDMTGQKKNTEVLTADKNESDRVYELQQRGFSLSEISREIFGDGRKTAKIREILRRRAAAAVSEK